MNKTSSIIIPDASALLVDTSCINVDEVEAQEDKDFLIEKGTNILRVVAKAALQCGKELLEVQQRFREETGDSKGTGLVKFYESLGLSMSQVSRWTCKYKAFLAYSEIFGTIDDQAAEKFNDMADRAAQNLLALPTDYREAFFADIALGKIPTQTTMDEVTKRPEVKLSKAEELLAAARIRNESASDQWEMVKADPDIKATSDEYKTAHAENNRASKILAKYEEKVRDLEAQILEEQEKVSEYQKREERTKSELEKLKFDDEQTRTERVKRLTASLTISVPQVMADLQKFFAEQEQYPEDIRAHLVEQSTYLANYIGDNL